MQKKRHNDPDNEDHTKDRSFDWRVDAPRWLLIALCTGSVGVNGLLGTFLIGLVIDRFHIIEKAQNDPKWDILKSLAEVQGRHSAKIEQNSYDIQKLSTVDSRISEIQSDIKVISSRLRYLSKEKE